MPDIEELDDTAQLVRVSWRKANNYYASFARILFETKAKLDSGAYGPEWTFNRWLLRKAGLFDGQVMRQLAVFMNVVATEEREAIERENKRIRAEKRAAAEKEKHERLLAKAIKLQRRLESEREKEELRAARLMQREEAQKAAMKSNIKKEQLKPSPSPEAQEILAECNRVMQSDMTTHSKHVKLGKLYKDLKVRVKMKLEGKDPNDKWWKWGTWTKAYIPDHGGRTISTCMKAHSDSLNGSQPHLPLNEFRLTSGI